MGTLIIIWSMDVPPQESRMMVRCIFGAFFLDPENKKNPARMHSGGVFTFSNAERTRIVNLVQSPLEGSGKRL